MTPTCLNRFRFQVDLHNAQLAAGYGAGSGLPCGLPNPPIGPPNTVRWDLKAGFTLNGRARPAWFSLRVGGSLISKTFTKNKKKTTFIRQNFRVGGPPKPRGPGSLRIFAGGLFEKNLGKNAKGAKNKAQPGHFLRPRAFQKSLAVAPARGAFMGVEARTRKRQLTS